MRNRRGKMNEAQIMFCEKYLAGLTGKSRPNATRAYMEVYPDCTEESARSSASELLTKDNIREYIAKRMGEMVMTTNEVIIRLADLAMNAEKDSDKIHALELIGRSQAMFLDRQDITSGGQTISLADYLNGIKQVADEMNNKKKLKYTGGITVLDDNR